MPTRRAPASLADGMTRSIALLFVAVVALGCADAGGVSKPEGDAPDPHAGGGGEMAMAPPRDPLSQPCNLDNWQRLLPDLRECDLAGAALGGANLRRADLTRSVLRDVRAERAELFKAVLVDANLARARLAGVNLTAADLTGANLEGADLRGARLTGAVFTGAALGGVTTDAATVCASGASGPCW